MHLEIAQILLLVEIMMVFAVSNTGVEHSFSTYNLIVIESASKFFGASFKREADNHFELLKKR